MIAPVRRALPLAVTVALLAAVLSIVPTSAGAGAAAPTWTLSPSDEAEYVAHINEVRAANGLGPLEVDADMTDAARSWTAWMAENTTLAHADDIVSGAPSDWLKVGENVGRGGSLDAVWQAFLASPSHAANILDPVYDYVGIGVIWTAEGRLYTTHRFASTESAESAPEPAAEPSPEPTVEPLPEPGPEPRPEPAPVSPPQLPFSEPRPQPATPAPVPSAEPGRLTTTMTLLLEAG